MGEDFRVDSITQACLWFADLPKLKGLFELSEDEVGNTIVHLVLRSEAVMNMIRTWTGRRKYVKNSCEDPEGSELQEPPTKKRRCSSPCTPRRAFRQDPSGISSSVATLCNERDKDTCVLTGFREPLEVAHIYPYSLIQMEERQSRAFWDVLKVFWAPEKVDAWKKHILDPDSIETCSNLMCMVNVAHKLWEKARFALKPLSLSEDQKVLKVAFYWLPRNKYSREIASVEAPSPFPCDLSSSKADGQHMAKLYNIATNTRISSGDIFTFETDDPVEHPLPSIELLNMQWILHRVLALSGVADATDEELDPDSDIWPGVDQEDSDWDSEEEM